MAAYWIKHETDGRVTGPFSGTDLKSMAGSGNLRPTAMVSADQIQWTVAAKVKGLFPTPAVAPTAPVVVPAMPPIPRTPPAAPPPPAANAPALMQVPPMPPVPVAAYYSGYDPDGSVAAVPRRNVQWFLVCAAALVGVGALMLVVQVGLFVIALGSHSHGGRPNPTQTTILGVLAVVRLLGLVFGWLFFLALQVYFVVWVYQIHDDMRRYSGGRYPISPGQACGFCFIPGFNVYWLVYMPYKLAANIDQQFGSTGKPTNPARVMTFQILQLVLNTPLMCLLLPSPIFFALSMAGIQKGMNRLVARSTGQGFQPVTSGARVDAAYDDRDETESDFSFHSIRWLLFTGGGVLVLLLLILVGAAVSGIFRGSNVPAKPPAVTATNGAPNPWRAPNFIPQSPAKPGFARAAVQAPLPLTPAQSDADIKKPWQFPDQDPSVKMTQLIGGLGGGPVCAYSASHRPVVGLKIELNGSPGQEDGIHVVEPLFDRNQPASATIVYARSGYVLGGMETASDQYLRAFRIIWIRDNNEKLNAADKYTSKWYGRPLQYQRVTLAGNGDRVVGLFGKHGLNQDGVGLVLANDP